jgi:hypothetical protein
MVHHREDPEIILHGLNDVEIVANALSIYVDYLTKEFSDRPPSLMTGPWQGGDSDCLHQVTTDIPTPFDSNVPSAKDVKCDRCGAIQTTADALDAVRGTLRETVELRQRIVKEWGYDPTHEG